MEEKSCCFIGHRTINTNQDLVDRLQGEIINLIEKGVSRFIFGSRSEFDYLCHSIVTELKEAYPNIIRIAYDTKSESSILEKDKERFDAIYFKLSGEESNFAAYDEVIKDDKMYVSGKASYIERNELMIDASDYCIFYYDENYKPPVRNRSKKYACGLWTSDKSGTAIAYQYALRRKKTIINVFVSQ